MSQNQFKKLVHHESAPGVLLLAAALLAMLCANSRFHETYDHLIHMSVGLTLDGGTLKAASLLHWINDGLMAVFFFQVGLELKREIVEGELSKPSQIALPALAAMGGVVVPAAIYAIINWGDATAMKGWAIPTATDIAFSLGALSLLGKKVPPGLKIFLLSLAIIDDLTGILIIAFFYTSHISMGALLLAAIILFILLFMNQKDVYHVAPYLVIGFILWVAFLQSGVHATLAGVTLAFFIPIRVKNKPKSFSPLKRLEKDLHPAVVFWILPIFAFTNTGIDLRSVISAEGIDWGKIFNPMSLGIIAALIVGKTVGVFTFTLLAVKSKLAKLPPMVNWKDVFGLSMLTGIGFTMSLFISGLAFDGGHADHGPEPKVVKEIKLNLMNSDQLTDDSKAVIKSILMPKTEMKALSEKDKNIIMSSRVGILVGSMLSAIFGFFLLKWSLKNKKIAEIDKLEESNIIF